MSQKFKALVPPRKGTIDGVGWCLRFAQTFFGAPVAHPSAWVAWQHTKFRHGPSVPLPSVPVMLWFEHWGDYDGTGKKNWGHVAPYVPGDGIYTSPWFVRWGQEKYQSIADIERVFEARYVGWSEDINGLRIAEPLPKEDEMPKSSRLTYRPKGGRKITNKWTYLTINGKGDVTVLGGGVKGRHAQAYCNLDVIGVVDVRAVVEKTSADGKRVEKSNVHYYERIDRLGTYNIPLDIPAGYRLRFQARALDKTPVIVGQMGYVTDYWDRP